MASEKMFSLLRFGTRYCGYGGLFLLAGLVGCTRYHLGFPVQRASFRSIYVSPAVNKAFVAQAQGILTRQVREEIIRNGYLELRGKEEADTILEMTIVKYGRSIGSVYETDPDTAKTLSLNLEVCCSLRNVSTGRYIIKGVKVNHSISICANNYAQSIEYQRLPQLTRELAKKIVLLIENTGD